MTQFIKNLSLLASFYTHKKEEYEVSLPDKKRVLRVKNILLCTLSRWQLSRDASRHRNFVKKYPEINKRAHNRLKSLEPNDLRQIYLTVVAKQSQRTTK